MLDNEDSKQYRAEIRAIAKRAGLPAEWADEQIDGEATLEAARAAAFEAMQTRPRPQIRTAAVPGQIEERQARIEALTARMTGKTPSEQARPFMDESLHDMARACVEGAGISTRGMGRGEIFERAMHAKSDFPVLLESGASASLMAAYQTAASPLKEALTRKITLQNFLPHERIGLGDIPPLEKVSEAGEIRHTTRSDSAGSIRLDSYGSIFTLSRQAIVNDYLGAFSDWTATAGRAAAETEANLLVTALRSNSGAGPTMNAAGGNTIPTFTDQMPLFDATHANIPASGTGITGAALSLEKLAYARMMMRKQTARDGTTIIGVAPKYLLVGPELESEAEKLLAQIYPATSDDANPFAGKLTLLVEPRLGDTEDWFLFAAPEQFPVFELAHLSSAPGPQISSRDGFEVLAREFRVTLDCGVGVCDFRGAFRSPEDGWS